jgi:signal transduction histidine kinase
MSELPPANYPAQRWPDQGGWAHSAGIDVDSVRRPDLVRLAVLPAVTVAVLAAVVTTVLVLNRSLVVTVALGAVGVLACLIIVIVAARQARTATYDIERRADEARQSLEATIRGLADFRGRITDFVAMVRRGERPAVDEPAAVPAVSHDRLAVLAQSLRQAQNAAQVAVLRAADNPAHGDPLQQLTVFGNLGRRQQSLVHRAIRMLDELEQQVEDPDLLKGLFAIDHLVTRIRRQTENLVVLGGATAPRQWSVPLTMVAVLRSAIAEVEQYNRVKLVLPIKGTLRGHAVAEIIHLLAELIENATVFSDPDTTVMLRARHVTAGLAIEVEDRGLGMNVDDLDRINELLSGAANADIGELLADGLIGLWVVAQLCRRNGVKARLHTNIFGGISADIVIPHGLLGEEREDEPNRPVRQLQPAGAQPPSVYDSGVLRSSTVGELPVRVPQNALDRLAGDSNWSAPGQPQPYGDVAGMMTGPQSQPHAQPQQQSQQHAQPHWPPNPVDRAMSAHESTTGPTPTAHQPQRPPLPKRPPGTNHLAPQLLGQPEVSDAVTGHTPNLMANFQQGVRSANGEETGDKGHLPTGE